MFREDIGYGAIYEAARILTRFQEELAGEKYLTFNPGVILGGTSVEFDPAQARGEAYGKQNVIAEHAVASGDLRMISLEQRDRTRERMRAIVAENLPHTSAEIEFTDGYPPMTPTDGNERLLAMLDRGESRPGPGPGDRGGSPPGRRRRYRVHHRQSRNGAGRARPDGGARPHGGGGWATSAL